MKICIVKKFSLILLSAISCTLLSQTISHAREYGRDRYEVCIGGLYSFSTTSSHHGGIQVEGFLPIHKYIEADINAGWNGPGTMFGSLVARPKLPLPCGELFLDAIIQYRSISNFQTSELVGVGTLGYRIDYASAQFGVLGRTIYSKGDIRIHDSKVREKVSMAYRLSFSIRPKTSRWNAGGGITNITPYECERMWQPLFFINGWYSFYDRLRLEAEIMVKPTGMFHQTVSFYGARASVGICYVF